MANCFLCPCCNLVKHSPVTTIAFSIASFLYLCCSHWLNLSFGMTLFYFFLERDNAYILLSWCHTVPLWTPSVWVLQLLGLTSRAAWHCFCSPTSDFFSAMPLLLPLGLCLTIFLACMLDYLFSHVVIFAKDFRSRTFVSLNFIVHWFQIMFALGKNELSPCWRHKDLSNQRSFSFCPQCFLKVLMWFS